MSASAFERTDNLYPVGQSAPPVPGLSLLRAEGLAALNVLWLVKQDLSVLDQVVDPHGPISCNSQHSLTCTFGQALGQRQVVHGQQESGRRTGTREVRQRKSRIKQGFMLLEVADSFCDSIIINMLRGKLHITVAQNYFSFI